MHDGRTLAGETDLRMTPERVGSAGRWQAQMRCTAGATEAGVPAGRRLRGGHCACAMRIQRRECPPKSPKNQSSAHMAGASGWRQRPEEPYTGR
jgi:hypothetical protein